MSVCVYLCVCVCISARVLKAAVGRTPEHRAADRKRSLQKKAEKAPTVAAVAETEGADEPQSGIDSSVGLAKFYIF